MLIRNDITGLNMALSDLQTLQNMEIADGSYSHDKFGHYRAVCDDLKTRLMGATKQFQYVLTVRSEVRFVPELLLLEMKCLIPFRSYDS